MTEKSGMTIIALTADEAAPWLAALGALLQEAVADGASVGFLPPLAEAEAADYWRGVAEALRAGSRILLIARDADGTLIGTAQLDLATRANGLHRAEVSRLLVARAARRRGVARTLLLALEEEARRLGRTTLVLDTREGDPAERLYAGCGYTRAGTIPQYARDADGTLAGTALYYKLLGGA